MRHRGWFDDDRWHRHQDRRHQDRRHGAPQGAAPAALAALCDTVMQAALWAAGCLALASFMPPGLVAPLLREMLLLSALFVSMVALLHGDTLSLRSFNRQDVALLLLALALVSGFFVDPAALEALAGPGGAQPAAGGEGGAARMGGG